MADVGDESVKLTEEALDQALQKIRSTPQTQARKHSGFCHYCNDAIAAPLVFCDEDCREDHRYETQRRAALRLN